MPPEMERLVGRRYVVEITISRYSLRREQIDFQVLKFFLEGGASYASFVSPGTSLEAPAADTSSIAEMPVGALVHDPPLDTNRKSDAITGGISDAKSTSSEEKDGDESEIASRVGKNVKP